MDERNNGGRKMKLFFTVDADRGNPNYIVAEDLRKALDLHKDKYGYDPEYIKELTTEDESVLIKEAKEANMPNMETVGKMTNSACMYYRHDFGLLKEEAQQEVREEGLQWYLSWMKAQEDMNETN
jgi:hypothetical protein